ncbi:MAG: XkdX family protein [Lacrimispora sphenoides]
MDQHSQNYDLVRGFYNAELWKISWVHDAVGKWITEKEYLDITGKEYKKA